MFEAQAARTPDAIAVVFGETVLSYDDLNRRANRLAHHLLSFGVRPMRASRFVSNAVWTWLSGYSVSSKPAGPMYH
nr:AMP-binding protein [Pectobacterium brasiliense]